jgi:hypothetical protein
MTAVMLGEQKESPQLIFSVVQDINGIRIITPASNFITVLGIVPADPETQYAPLNKGDIMLCRAYEGIAENEQKVFGLRCGTDNYFVKTLALIEKNKVKNE